MNAYLENSYGLVLAFLLGAFTLVLAGSSIARRAPVIIHNIAWIVCLALIGSDLVHYDPLSGKAWLLITLGIGAFNLGVIIPATGPQLPEAAKVRPLVSAHLFAVLLGGYTIGYVIYIRAVVANVGIGAFFGEAYKLRETQGSAAFLEAFPLPAKLLFYLGPLLFIVVANGWAVTPTLTRGTRSIVFVYLVISMVSSLQRTNLLQALMWQIGVLVIRPEEMTKWVPAARARPNSVESHKTRRTVLVSVLLVGFCVAGFQVIAIARNQTSEADRVAGGAVSPLLQQSGLTSLSIYATAGIPAFSNLVNGTNSSNRATPSDGSAVIFNNYNPQTWGRSTAQGFLKVFPVAEPWPSISPFTRTPIATNVYTWYEPYYRDFRELGVILLTFGSGLGIAFLHRRRSLGPHYLLAAALLVGCSGRAPFTNQLTSIYTLEPLVILAFLGWRSRRVASGCLEAEVTTLERNV